MPSMRIASLAVLAAAASALPTPFVDIRHIYQRQQPNETAAPSGLSDFDILQFALTLENLEESFYREGFAKFPESDFAALGLNKQQLSDLKAIGQTEQEHVILLQSALAQGGIKPVERCEYQFNFTDAKSMVATASVLENVGVSAYLGAAPLIQDKSILGTAASITTIESRHQSAIRVLTGQQAVPNAFDASLSPKAVFSLAAPFIKSCPSGSNLKIEAFPALAMASGQTASALAIGSTVKVESGATGATNCAFTTGGVAPGGTAFSKFSQTDGCQIPQGVAGVTYLSLTSSAPLTGKLSDDIIVAGPMILNL